MPALKSTRDEGGVLGFFKGLFPTFKRAQVEDDLSAIFKELHIAREMYTFPADTYNAVLRKQFSVLNAEMRQVIPKYRGSIILTIQDALKTMADMEGPLQDEVQRIFGPVIFTSKFDYEKLNFLRYLEALAFFSTYVRKFLMVVTNESLDSDSVASPVNQMDIDLVMNQDNAKAFAAVTRACLMSTDDLKRAISKMAKVSFDPDTHTVVSINHPTDADPLAFGYLPIIGGLTVMIGKANNLRLAKRQEIARAEQTKLQITVQLLNRRLETERDEAEITRLKKQIQGYNNIINKYTAQLERLEEK